MSLVGGSRAEVIFDVNGTREARRDIESVGDSMGGMGAKIGALAKSVGALAVLAGVAAFGSWIKGAIDATDAASDLSQKTGIAIKDLAGLELAYQMGGMEADALASTQSKLSKALVDGSEGLEKLGVKARNLDGSLKSNKQVMYELADRFAGMEDGAQKTALAMSIFGKSGADMIPMLNSGSEGMRELDEMAGKLGLTLSDEAVEQAGAFNDTLDLLMLGGQGVARGIAAELLPTLSSLAGSFLTAMTEGDRLKTVGQLIAGVFKAIYTVGVPAVQTFQTVGKVIGGFAAMVTTNLTGAIEVLQKVAGGDFKGAWDAIKQTAASTSTVVVDVAKDVGRGWTGAWDSVVNVWTDGGNKMIDTMVGIKKASTTVGLSAAEVAKQAAAANKEHAAQAKTLAELSGVTATYMEDLSRLYGMRQKGLVTEEQYVDLVTQLIAKQPEAKKLMDETAKETEEYAKAIAAATDALNKDLDSIAKQVQAQQQQNAEIGLTTAALAELEIARIESLALRKEEEAGIAEGLDLTGRMAQGYRDQAAALRELASEKRSGAKKQVVADNAATAKEEWKRAADSIEQSLTDALMRGFESGKGFGKNLVDTIRNMFNTLVLRPIVSAIVNPVAGAVTGALGLTGNAAAATGGGGLGGAVGTLGTIGSLTSGVGLLGAAGLGMQAGFGALMSSGLAGISGAVSGGIAAIGAGTASSIAAGIGTIAGALGPIALGIGAAVAVWKKFDTSGTSHTGGAASASSVGANTVKAESLGFQHTKVSNEVNSMTAQLASGIVGILDSTALAFGKTAGYTAATAFADDTSKDGAWGALVIQKMGQDVVDWNDTRQSKWAPREFADGEKGQEQYLGLLSRSVRTALDGIGLPAWAQTMLNGIAKDASLEDLAKVVDQINATQSALAAMRVQLVGFSSLSDTAVSALMAASGGIDKLFSNASSYYDAFYTEAEKNAAASQQIAKALASVNLQMPTSREGFRALVEAQMRMGERGAEAVSVLLGVADAFAQVNQDGQTVTVDLASYRSALTDAYNAESEALKATISRMGSFATSLRNLKDSALLGDLSPLSPQQKYAEAKSQYDAVLAAARGGDADAQGRYQDAYISFLEASRVMYASSIGYTQDFQYAQAATEDAAKWAEEQVDVGQAQLDSLKDSVSGLIEVNKSVLSVREAILQLNAASSKNTVPLTAVAPPVNTPIPYSSYGTANTEALVSAVKSLSSENAMLRAEQRQQTGDLIRAVQGSAASSSDKISGAVKAAATTEMRVLPE